MMMEELKKSKDSADEQRPAGAGVAMAAALRRWRCAAACFHHITLEFAALDFTRTQYLGTVLMWQTRDLNVDP